MRNLFLFVLFCFLNTSIYSQNILTTNNPQSWWQHQEGSISNLEITIKPEGRFAQVEFTFDVLTAFPEYYYEEDLLEYVMDFDLDDDAMVNDSWLWIYNYISKGVIYEKWEGTTIYEGIVNRQQDPSILTKESDTHYQLRIYPLLPDSTRKVKVSYLQPMKARGDHFELNVPVKIFNESYVKVNDVRLFLDFTEEWLEPEFDNDQMSLEYQDAYFFEYQISDLSKLSQLTVPFIPVENKEIFIGIYTTEEESYYQLAYYPDHEIEVPGKNHLFIIDFDENNVTLSKNEVLNQLSDAISSYAGPNDFFNIVYSDFAIKTLHADWIEASTDNILSAFDELKMIGIDHISSLRPMIAEGLDILNKEGDNSSMIVISSNDAFGNQTSANTLVEEITSRIQNDDMIINVLDIADRSLPYHFINGQGYRGNEYFYHLLTNQTNGYHFSLYRGDNIDEATETLLQSDLLLLEQFDFHVSLSNGFTYSNYLTNNNNQNFLSLGQPIINVGKFHGDGTFEVELTGIHDDLPFNYTIELEKDELVVLDSLTEKIWAGLYIADLENENDPVIQSKVIEKSEEERMLSKLTTFLCLEPDSIALETINEGGDVVNTTEEETKDAMEIKAYPNPFSDILTIEFRSEEPLAEEDFKVRILNTQGQLIDEITDYEKSEDGLYLISWNASDQLMPGIYIVQIIISKGSETIKVVKV